jgi:hypothetical protein
MALPYDPLLGASNSDWLMRGATNWALADIAREISQIWVAEELWYMATHGRYPTEICLLSLSMLHHTSIANTPHNLPVSELLKRCFTASFPARDSLHFNLLLIAYTAFDRDICLLQISSFVLHTASSSFRAEKFSFHLYRPHAIYCGKLHAVPPLRESHEIVTHPDFLFKEVSCHAKKMSTSIFFSLWSICSASFVFVILGAHSVPRSDHFFRSQLLLV